MIRRPLRTLGLASALTLSVALAGCSTDEGCIATTDCELGQKCERPNDEDPGECVACAATETPYDGVDNDCKSQTRDSDLDRDGENSKTAGIGAGADCNDNDANVNTKAKEVCDDNIDNDCDDQTDEIDCRDLVGPTVEWLAPTPGSTIMGTVAARLDAMDDAKVEKVEIFHESTLLGSDTTAPFEISFDSTRLPEGQVSLRAVATDIGNRTASDDAFFVVDNSSGPVITVTSPASDASYDGNTAIAVSAADAAGVARIEVFIDGVSSASATSETLNGTFDASTLAEGDHTLRIETTDVSGNSSSTEGSFRVDRTGPVVTIDPADGAEATGSIIVSVTAADPAGIRQIDANAQSGSASPLEFNLDTLTLPNGPYDIDAVAWDATIIDGQMTGNRSSPARSTITVFNQENVAPVTRFIEPTDGDGVFGSTDIRVDANSPKGIDRVEILVDGVTIAEIRDPPYRTVFDYSRTTGSTSVIEAIATDGDGITARVSSNVVVVHGPNLRRAIEVPVPAGTTNFEVGDLDGDGRADLLLYGGNSGAVILPGSGSFTFGAPISLNANLERAQLIDYDQDGDLDVVGVGVGSVYVILNEGGGVFAAPAQYAYAPAVGARAFYAADFDSPPDGRPDVIVGNDANGLDFVVLRQLPNRRLVVAESIGLVGGIVDIAVGDIEGDGDLDIAVGRGRTSFVTVFINQGARNFIAGRDYPTRYPLIYVEFAKVDTDAYLDLVGITEGRAISVLRCDGANPPGFVNHQTIELPADPNGYDTPDLNGDGISDLVVTLPVGNQMEVRENLNGRFGTRRNYIMAKDVRSPRGVDLDGDDDLDIAALDGRGETLVIAPNRGANVGAWRFGAAPVLPLDFLQPPPDKECVYGRVGNQLDRVPGTVNVGEVVGGGNADLVFGVDRIECEIPLNDQGTQPQFIPPAAAMFENFGGGDFAPIPAVELPRYVEPREIAIGDLDGAFNSDMAVASQNQYVDGDTAALVLSTSTVQPTYAIQPIHLDKPSSTAIGDPDNDGNGNAIFAATGPIGHGGRMFEANGLESPYNFVIPQAIGANSVVAGNIDNDSNGYLDFAIANSRSDNITLWSWNGSAFDRVIFNTNVSISALHLMQFPNVDPLRGKSLVGIGESGVVILHPTNPGIFDPPVSFSAGQPSAPFQISGGDYNRDGIGDLLVLNQAQDAVAMLFGRPRSNRFPSGGFFAPYLVSTNRQPQDMAEGLIWENSDDIVVINKVIPGIMFLLNESN
ncbi:MAG: VCBS repeat-containing protein [Deltaproteobacteria bacterium]|nr:VCBS repeat-containing protein [Deltaproteobacteria bacterium]